MGQANKKLLAPRLGERRARASFVLIEVLVSMTILGVASMAFLDSFGYSLNAARQMEIFAQAGFLAERLFEQFELDPPREGDLSGDFGADYKNYSYVANVRYVDPGYDLKPPDDVEQFFALRQAAFNIVYDDGVHDPMTVLTVETAIEGFERFDALTKKSYYIF